MKSRRKTWSEKYQTTAVPSVQRLEKAFGDMREGDRMLIATPKLIESYVREIPPGWTVTVKKIRADLASQHDADTTCAITTGIFLRIAAEVAWEQHQAGQKLSAIMPFWRAIDPGSPAAKKLACGPEFIRQQRDGERRIAA